GDEPHAPPNVDVHPYEKQLYPGEWLVIDTRTVGGSGVADHESTLFTSLDDGVYLRDRIILDRDMNIFSLGPVPRVTYHDEWNRAAIILALVEHIGRGGTPQVQSRCVDPGMRLKPFQ